MFDIIVLMNEMGCIDYRIKEISLDVIMESYWTDEYQSNSIFNGIGACGITEEYQCNFVIIISNLNHDEEQ